MAARGQGLVQPAEDEGDAAVREVLDVQNAVEVERL